MGVLEDRQCLPRSWSMLDASWQLAHLRWHYGPPTHQSPAPVPFPPCLCPSRQSQHALRHKLPEASHGSFASVASKELRDHHPKWITLQWPYPIPPQALSQSLTAYIITPLSETWWGLWNLHSIRSGTLCR